MFARGTAAHVLQRRGWQLYLPSVLPTSDDGPCIGAFNKQMSSGLRSEAAQTASANYSSCTSAKGLLRAELRPGLRCTQPNTTSCKVTKTHSVFGVLLQVLLLDERVSPRLLNRLVAAGYNMFALVPLHCVFDPCLCLRADPPVLFVNCPYACTGHCLCDVARPSFGIMDCELEHFQSSTVPFVHLHPRPQQDRTYKHARR